MGSILDIDLDYFNLMDHPIQRLEEILDWAKCPIAFVEEEHHNVLRRWKTYVKNGRLPEPKYILHADEHHDMMDEKSRPNIANVMYHAMCLWPECRVHWLVEHPIDSPSMWLSDEAWELLSKRFSCGRTIPSKWPKPQFVSICTSPDFVRKKCYAKLTEFIKRITNTKQVTS